MSYIIVLASLVFSDLSLACPTLSGEYMCKDQKGAESLLNLSQREENGVMVYNDQSDDYYTDGKEHSLDWGFFVGKYIATCPGDTLVINMDGEVYTDDGKFADVKNLSSYKMSGSTLLIDEKYMRTGLDGKTEEINDSHVCTLN